MTSRRLATLDDDGLALALSDLGAHLAVPTIDVAQRVTERLPIGGSVVPMRRGRTLRRAGLIAVAAVLLVGAAAAAGRLGVPGLKIVFGSNEQQPIHAPVGRNLFLGHVAPLQDARDRVPFAVYTPHGQHLGPASVYLGDEPPGGRVSLVYPPGPGIPRSRFTHAGLLITQFEAGLDYDFMKKATLGGTRVRYLNVNGYQGVWFSGQPHEVQYLDRNKIPYIDSTRLAGHTLVWSQGPVTLRLECNCSLKTARRIVNSMR